MDDEQANGVQASNSEKASKHDTEDVAKSASKDHTAQAAGKDEEEGEVDMRCGYFSWRPNCLQKLNKPQWLLVTVMFMAFSQGFVVNGIVNVNMTTLERRFGLSSGQVAWIASSYDIGGGFLALIFGYLGTFIHKGRMIAVSAGCMGCGSFLWILPHFLAGIYEAGAAEIDLCDAAGNSSECETAGSNHQNYLPIFIISQLLMSIGGAAVYTLSVPLLDESVRRKNSALYIGLLMSCSVLGPGVGLIVGGIFLQFYVDFGRVDMNDISISPRDPRWVGAWWMGFVYSGFASLLVMLLVACFPRELPSARKYRPERVSEAHAGRGEAESSADHFGRHPKDLLVSLKILFLNPLLVCNTISGILEYGLVLGVAAFLPKILQFQFAQSPSMAAVWAGVVVVPAATLGHILGGLIPKWLQLKVRGLIIQVLVFNALSVLLIFQTLLKCDMPRIAGISVSYDNSSVALDADSPDVDNPCNINCSCSTVSYDPVCGQNQVTYFTPCHAGCLNSTGEGSDKVYHNCSCISMEAEVDPQYPDGVAGVCEEDCSVLPVFLVLFFLLNLCTFIPLTAGSAATMRYVPDKQRSFAYGVQSTIVRYLGNVPGPLLLGAIFDRSCWLWQETCDGRGSCWIYNVDDVAKGLLAVGLSFKLGSFFITLLSLFCYKPPPPKVESYIMNSTTDTAKDTAETVLHTEENVVTTGNQNIAKLDRGNVDDTLKTENSDCNTAERLAADNTEHLSTSNTADNKDTAQTQDIVNTTRDEQFINSAFIGDGEESPGSTNL